MVRCCKLHPSHQNDGCGPLQRFPRQSAGRCAFKERAIFLSGTHKCREARKPHALEAGLHDEPEFVVIARPPTDAMKFSANEIRGSRSGTSRFAVRRGPQFRAQAKVRAASTPMPAAPAGRTVCRRGARLAQRSGQAGRSGLTTPSKIDVFRRDRKGVHGRGRHREFRTDLPNIRRYPRQSIRDWRS